MSFNRDMRDFNDSIIRIEESIIKDDHPHYCTTPVNHARYNLFHNGATQIRGDHVTYEYAYVESR